MTVTTATSTLHDLIETLKRIDALYDKGSDLTDAEDRQLSLLDARRDSLEDMLKAEVKDKLGVDYVVLWHAVTPSEPAPTSKGRWII